VTFEPSVYCYKFQPFRNNKTAQFAAYEVVNLYSFEIEFDNSGVATGIETARYEFLPAVLLWTEFFWVRSVSYHR
jgi:hypothetical protein